jgi:cysteine desulfurase / selenocysteine lyase
VLAKAAKGRASTATSPYNPVMTSTQAALDVRGQFPGLAQTVNGRRLAYLDSAATCQRPERVLTAMDGVYRRDNANVHRGVHTLSQRATERFDAARARVAAFVRAPSPEEVLFTKGCTEAVNLVAASWGRANLRPGDTVLLGTSEHHANIVPWQLVAEQSGAKVEPIRISDDGALDLEQLHDRLAQGDVRLVGVKHVCNALGTVNPVADVAALARAAGALTLVDGAQGLAHEPVDVAAWGVDFYAMSAHKVYGPMGVGALFGRRELLDAMPPYQGGGDMIRTVSFEGTTFNSVPNKCEPGTPNVPGVIGFAAALDWVEQTGLAEMAAHERGLASEARRRLSAVPGVRAVGPADGAGVVSFVCKWAHPHDLGTVLDAHGVAVRTGHHCCMPLMARLGVPATARASFAAYSHADDVDQLVEAVLAAKALLGCVRER